MKDFIVKMGDRAIFCKSFGYQPNWAIYVYKKG